jgi:hypothetical protein
MSQPNQNSKIPPFVFDEQPVPAKREPTSRPLPSTTRPVQKYTRRPPSERGMLNVAILLISSLSLGIALTGGTWIGLDILQNGFFDSHEGLFSKIVAAGLSYAVGWVVALFGMRKLHNVLLPFAIKAYAWLTLGGIAILQIAIISKLFKQVYSLEKFAAYVIMFGVGIAALVGFHLLVEKHNLVPFSFPIIIISLAHLYLIVFHYIFFPEGNVRYEYIWGDVIFFLVTAVIGALMLAHVGILSGFRNGIDKFSDNTDHFVPPR